MRFTTKRERKIGFKSPTFPVVREFNYSVGDSFDYIMQSVGISGADETIRDGKCYVRFDSAESLEKFYHHLFRMHRPRRVLRLGTAT
jgi:hypothetical protein